MLRKFINQDKLSNKFWNIEINGKIQKISYGKIDTKGREGIKEFASEAECVEETNKLISQKLKKGYVELTENDIIPIKEELSIADKADIYFWEAISKSNKYKNANWSEYDVEEHLENLTELLSKYGKERLILFEKTLREKLQKLYTAEIAELSIILENEFKNQQGKIIYDNQLSDDGFVYFRCWLLLKGEEFFNEITKDINSFVSGKYSVDIGDCWAEGLLYVADDAFGISTEIEDSDEIRDAVDELYPEVIHYDSVEREMNREIKAGDELQKIYPALVEEISKMRSK